MAVGRDVVMRIKGEQEASGKNIWLDQLKFLENIRRKQQEISTAGKKITVIGGGGLDPKLIAQATAEWKAHQKQLDGTRLSVTDIATGFLAIRSAIGLGISAVRGLVSTFHELAMASESARKTNERFERLFAGMAGESKAWATEFAGAVGNAKDDVMGWMNGLQRSMVNLGINRREAAGFSKELTKVAVDFARFNGLAEESVIHDFQMAIASGRSSLRAYGIVMDEDTVKTAAYRMGVADLGAELTKQQEVITRINLLHEMTAESVGAAQRGMGTYSDDVRRLNTEWKELKEAAGAGLANINKETGFLKEVKNNIGWMQDLKGTWLGVKQAIGENPITAAYLSGPLAPLTLLLGISEEEALILQERIKLEEELKEITDKKARQELTDKAAANELNREAILLQEADIKNAEKRQTQTRKWQKANLDDLDELIKKGDELIKKGDELIRKKEEAWNSEKTKMAEQFGYMSKAEKSRVARLAEKLKGPEAEEFLRGAREKTLDFIRSNEYLRGLAQPNIQRIGAQGLNIKISLDASDSIAQRLLEEAVPKITEALFDVREGFRRAVEGDMIYSRANDAALAGG